MICPRCNAPSSLVTAAWPGSVPRLCLDCGYSWDPAHRWNTPRRRPAQQQRKGEAAPVTYCDEHRALVERPGQEVPEGKRWYECGTCGGWVLRLIENKEIAL